MCSIYQDAMVTIVAANAAISDQGFLQVRQPPAASFEIPFWGTEGQLGFVKSIREETYDDRAEPVNTRAWTVQERLLLKRLLIYSSDTIQFQCRQQTVNIGNVLYCPAVLGSWHLPAALLGGTQNIHEKRLSYEAAIKMWNHIIEFKETFPLRAIIWWLWQP